jgi:hypothetical protein
MLAANALWPLRFASGCSSNFEGLSISRPSCGNEARFAPPTPFRRKSSTFRRRTSPSSYCGREPERRYRSVFVVSTAAGTLRGSRNS